MNALTRWTPAVTLAATLAAAFMVQASNAQAAQPMPVVTLPKVEITGSRALLQATPVVTLPRVTVIGKRMAPAATELAQTAAARRL